MKIAKFNNARSIVAYGHDLCMASLSFPLALYLRLGDQFFFFTHSYLVQGTVVFSMVAALVFAFSRLYLGIWRYASVNDMVAILRTVTLTILIFLPILFFLFRLENIPRSTPVIQWFVLVALMGGPRFLYRSLKDRRFRLLHENIVKRRIPVLLIGAGDAAELFIREQQRGTEILYKTIGVLSVKSTHIGREIRGVPVLGHVDDATDIIQNRLATKPEKIIITNEKIEGTIIRDLLTLSDSAGIKLSRLPKLSDFQNALADGADVIKPIAVEDLLGRPQTRPDLQKMSEMIKDRVVMITGAGGSIGTELVRQIAALNPAHIVLFEVSEYALYKIDQMLSEATPSIQHTAFLGDIRDYPRLVDVMQRFKPKLVFHSAALKHVPLVEANPIEGILTNIIGTRNVADACLKTEVDCMVMISTDKAVNPTNVMGASKRLAECYIQARDQAARPNGQTAFVVVRFGNVLGSTGSVIPLFQKQLAKGGPLTVTHPDITRYFMTMREAVELVLQASAVGILDNDTTGRILVLDMGKPIKIADLAQQMILLAGLKPDEDIAIHYTGLRPGEKLFEELLYQDENLLPTRSAGILLATPRISDLNLLQDLLTDLEKQAKLRNQKACLDIIKSQIPEFSLDHTTRDVPI